VAIKHLQSFRAGELDPALHEQVNFDRYREGLNTAKNVVVTKTGRIISRPARVNMVTCGNTGESAVLFFPPAGNYFIEIGYNDAFNYYIRARSLNGTIIDATTFAAIGSDERVSVLFSRVTGTNVDNIYVLVKYLYRYKFTFNGTSIASANISVVPNPPTSADVVSGSPTGTGYTLDYAISFVYSDRESLPFYRNGDAQALLPIVAGETIKVEAGISTSLPIPDYAKIYRRPANGGAYGYVGKTSYSSVSGGTRTFVFTDVGSDADYLHTPVEFVPEIKEAEDHTPSTLLDATNWVVYQSRLLYVTSGGEFVASQVGNEDYFHAPPLIVRDDQSFSFRVKSPGFRRVFHFVEDNGLILFTNVGVFVHRGAFIPENLIFEKKGEWISSEFIPPLKVPNGLLFIDESSNSIKILKYSDELGVFRAEDLTVNSDHLFKGRSIRSWAYQGGETPMVWVVFSDGKLASLTYEDDGAVGAWTRHDSRYPYERVASREIPDGDKDVFFIVNKLGQRWIEYGVRRYPANDMSVAQKMLDWPLMDGMATYSITIQTESGQTVTLAAVNPGPDYEGPITITAGGGSPFSSGWVGRKYRHFNPEDGSAVTLEITGYTSGTVITATPSARFPSAYISNPVLYRVITAVAGLTHLANETVSVVVDGAIVASPNNDIENYPIITVDGSGVMTLPFATDGAVFYVGRPVTCDVQTLDIDTVEQRPILFESKNISKLYLKIINSIGFYIGNRFPKTGKVLGMEDMDHIGVDFDDDSDGFVLGNVPRLPYTRRLELTLPGDWRSQGKIAMRQVDPLHFELLSVTPDLDDLRRGR